MACGKQITLAREGLNTPFYVDNVVAVEVLDFDNDVYILE